MPATFIITKFDYLLESSDGALAVKESDYTEKVRYEGPFFCCDVDLKCTIPAGETWTVGFVQVCELINLQHTYESGNYTKWEFPTPISDSTTSSFPYYSLGAPVVSGRRNQTGGGVDVLTGPVNDKKVTLSMNDNLNSNVQWWDPVPPGQTNYDKKWPETLTRISRKQKFTTYVVAHKGRGGLTSTTAYLGLAKVTWQMHFAVDFDCGKVAGLRGAKTYENSHNIVYWTKDPKRVTLPNCCFVNTNANAVQKLVGYSSAGTVMKAKIPW